MYVSGVESFVAIITALHLFILTQIKRAREEAEQHRQDAANHAKEALTLEDEFDPDKRQRNYTLQSPEQVLVRLKVEHSGFTTLNNQRFGSRFVGEVVSCLLMLIQSVCDMPCIRVSIRHYSYHILQANPSDILLFHRRRQAENTTAKGAATKKKRAAAGMYEPTEPEELEEVNVEDLVNENLFNMDKKLELLTEREMGEGMLSFQLLVC
jgi:double-strand break repair protein MRE11